MAWEEATIPGSGIDDTTIVEEAVEEATGQRAGKVHVKDGGGRWLVGGVVRRAESGGACTAAKNGIAHRDGSRGDGIGRETMALKSGRDVAPLALGSKTKAVVERGLRCAGDAAREGGERRWQKKSGSGGVG